MARFYASIQGNKGEASRMGSAGSGISGHIRGWDSGVEVFGHVNQKGEDEFHVYSTGGSNGGERKMIAIVENGRVFPQ